MRVFRAGLSVAAIAVTAIAVFVVRVPQTAGTDPVTTPVPRLPEPVARSTSVKASKPKASPAQVDADLQELIDEWQRLQAMARYPQWSQPLELVGDALAAAEYDVPETQSAGVEGAEPVLMVRAEKSSFAAPEPIVIRAALTANGQAVPATLTARVVDGAAVEVARILFTQAMAQPAQKLHFPYHAAFMPSVLQAPSAAFVIHVTAIASDGTRREAHLPVVYTQVPAKLTGRFRDAIDGGDLIIDAEVVVEQGGEFQLDGSLYSAVDRRPIAWATATQRLVPGQSSMRLKFPGLVMRDLEIDGPYLLRFVALTARTETAEAKSRPLIDAFTTSPYSWLQFDGEPQHERTLLAEAVELRSRIDRLRQERIATR